MKVLLDENATLYFAGLKKLGYDVVSVLDLQKAGIKCKTDYSMLKIAEKEEMVVVSCDHEVIDACKENNMPCVEVVMFKKHKATEWVHERLQALTHNQNK